jgi:hypothetical protein
MATTLAQILARLDRLEAKLAAPAAVDRSAEQVVAQINLIAERRREASGWRPCGVGVATLIEKARGMPPPAAPRARTAMISRFERLPVTFLRMD